MRKNRTPYQFYEFKDELDLHLLSMCLFDALDDCNEIIEMYEWDNCSSDYVNAVKGLVNTMEKVSLYMKEKIPAIEKMAEDYNFLHQDDICIGGVYYDRSDLVDW